MPASVCAIYIYIYIYIYMAVSILYQLIKFYYNHNFIITKYHGNFVLDIIIHSIIIIIIP